MQVELRSKSDYVTYNTNNNILTLTDESQILEMPLISSKGQDNNNIQTDQQNKVQELDNIQHSQSCTVFPDTVDKQESIDKEEAFQDSINIVQKNIKKSANKPNNKEQISPLFNNQHRKSSGLNLNQHPLMNFQKVRSILYELQQDEIDHNGIQEKEDQYRKLFSYGREAILQWKDQALQHPSEAKYLRIATLTCKFYDQNLIYINYRKN